MTHTFTPAQLAWLEALESGEYKQTKFALKNGDSYCCLGVACEVSGLGEFKDNYYHCEGEEPNLNFLPGAVAEQLNLCDRGGNVVDSCGKLRSLMHYNDQLKLNFNQIAAHIRANASKIFIE